jgi:hypothetical protein
VQADIYEIRNVKKNRNTKTKRKMEKGRKRGRKEEDKAGDRSSRRKWRGRNFALNTVEKKNEGESTRVCEFNSARCSSIWVVMLQNHW